MVILMSVNNMRLTDICTAVSLPATPSSRTSPSSMRCTMGSTAAQMHAGKTAWGGCSMWWVGVCSVVFSSSDGREKKKEKIFSQRLVSSIVSFLWRCVLTHPLHWPGSALTRQTHGGRSSSCASCWKRRRGWQTGGVMSGSPLLLLAGPIGGDRRSRSRLTTTKRGIYLAQIPSVYPPKPSSANQTKYWVSA